MPLIRYSQATWANPTNFEVGWVRLLAWTREIPESPGVAGAVLTGLAFKQNSEMYASA